MTLGERCDEIMRLIDDTLTDCEQRGESAGRSRPAGPPRQPGRAAPTSAAEPTPSP